MSNNGIKTKIPSKKKVASCVDEQIISPKRKCKIEIENNTNDDIYYIKQVVKVLKDNNLSEITYETDHSKLKIVSQISHGTQAVSIPQIVSSPQIAHDSQKLTVSQISSATQTTGISQTNASTQADIALSTSSSSIQGTQNYQNHPGAIKSPMVGTCYLSSEPNAPTFVNLGDTIKKGQPLLIIEAMKVMNYIKAPKDGKIVHIAVKDAQPIEYDQLLMVIE